MKEVNLTIHVILIILVLFIFSLSCSVNSDNNNNKTTIDSLQNNSSNNVSTVLNGERLYSENCALCHQDTGEGAASTFPALKNNNVLNNKQETIKTILKGKGDMQAIYLNKNELISVINYINNNWGNNYGDITDTDIKK